MRRTEPVQISSSCDNQLDKFAQIIPKELKFAGNESTQRLPCNEVAFVAAELHICFQNTLLYTTSAFLTRAKGLKQKK